jgi:rSAM/selenodomain-associated transferase 2
MKIAVVVPAVNEAERLGETLSTIRRLPGDFEIVVVDGGSSDDTVRIARDMDVPVVVGPRGRGPQMNYGASLASGDVLLFLHADTRLPRDAHALITGALRDDRVIGGCFRLSFDQTHPLLRFLSYCSRFRFRLLHYGDQAFFVRAGWFRESGGYRAYPIMEDLDFWLRMVRGGKVTVLDAAVVSSARRFSRYGIFRQQLRNVLFVGLFFIGVSPFTLSRLYRDVR